MEVFSFGDIETILKNDASLEKLLSENDIISEAKTRSIGLGNSSDTLENDPLIEFLVRKENLLGLFEVIAIPNPELDSSEKELMHIKNALGLLTSGIKQIDKAIADDPPYLIKLFEYWEAPGVSKIQFSFVMKAILSFISNTLSEFTLNCLKENPKVTEVFFSYNDFSMILEFLIALLTRVPEENKALVDEFIYKQDIVAQLIEKFRPDNSDFHYDFYHLFVSVMEKLDAECLKGSFYQSFLLEKNLRRLFELIFLPGNYRANQYGTLLITYLIKTISNYEKELKKKFDDNEIPRIVGYTSQNMTQFKELLSTKAMFEPLILGDHKYVNPVGPARIAVLDLINSLLNLGCELINDQMCDLNIFFDIFDLFFAYPHNSILQKSIEDILNTILDSKDEKLCRSLFTHTTDLRKRIIQYYTENEILLFNSSPELQANRKANAVFVFLFTEKIIQLSSSNADLARSLEDPEWLELVDKFEKCRKQNSELVPHGGLQGISHAYELQSESVGSVFSSEEEPEESQEEDDLKIPDDADLSSADDHKDYETSNIEVLLSKQDIDDLLPSVEA